MKKLIIALSLFLFPISAQAENDLTIAALSAYAVHFTASSTAANHGVGYWTRVLVPALLIGVGGVVYMQGKDQRQYQNQFKGVAIGVSVSAVMNLFQSTPEAIHEKEVVEVAPDCGDPIKWDLEKHEAPVINNNITIHNSNGKEGAK